MVLVPVQADTRRSNRLLKVFGDVTKGGRQIKTSADARLFLEAIRANPSPAACLETVTASEAGISAVRNSVRIESSSLFIREHVIPFIGYLADPAVKMVYNGQLLSSTLLLIVHPPLLWSNLFKAYMESLLNEEELFVFSWLCCELASLPGKDYVAVTDDIHNAIQGKPFSEAQDHRTREMVYRIKKVLALRQSANPDQDINGAGGRHDNDFPDFREISIFPTSDEFYSNAVPFYQRSTQIAAIDATRRPGAHLDNQFRLLREDMLGELREDLQVSLGKKKGRKAAHVLGDLEFAGIDTGDEKRGRACTVLLSCRSGLAPLVGKSSEKRKKFLDENRGYLRHQSFGALCGDDYIVAFAFTVRDMDKLVQNDPIVGLQFTNSDALARAVRALQSPAGLRFVLVDTPVFAYQPVLECLQALVEMPLDGELLRLETDQPDTKTTSQCAESTIVHQDVQQFEQLLRENSTRFTMDDKRFNLDRSQMLSVLHALQQKTGLIQGPPGTGKSFVGALTAKIILKDPEKRILVLSYTNHALDQFLEDLMNIGISPELMTRLGSKFNDTTQRLSFEHQLRGSTINRSIDTWKKIDGVKSEMAELRLQLEETSKTLMRRTVTFPDVMDYLEFSDNYQDFYETFKLPEQDQGFKFAGKKKRVMSPEYLYERWSKGYNAGQLHHLVSPEYQYCWDMPIQDRVMLHQKWINDLYNERLESVQNLARRFDDAQGQIDSLFGESRCKFVQTKRVIGCTTTAAAKYKSLIKAAKPDVVLVEEAGEILEAHVLTALHPATSQLILIGDHQQLRPKINNYALSVEKGEGFDFNRSLFERLILQGHEHVTLQKQHRMHPDISELVRHMTYPDLRDDPKTLSRPEPKGLIGRVIFMNHSHAEFQDRDIVDKRDVGLPASKKNDFEAHMVLKIVRYLSQQGYKSSNMVVLTPYLGQLRLLRDLLSSESDPILNDMDSFELKRAGLMTAAAAKVKAGSGSVRLSTIDNYQGEESDIVIASLTRSNKKGDIGFMKAPERLNVLCSRARECLVMVGDMETFMASTAGKPVWESFFSLLKEKQYLHDGLSVRCQQHPEKTALLKDPEDFEASCPDGGCDEKCDSILSCGKHKCQKRCHRISDHSKTPCYQRVKKVCERNHKFKVNCTDKDAICKTCRDEDDAMRARLKRDLQMEKDRVEAQKRYAREIREVEAEIDHERRRLKYSQQEDDDKKKLEQNRAELEALRETRSRAEKMAQEEIKRSSTKSSSTAGQHSLNSQSEKSTEPSVLAGAQEEWETMKKASKGACKSTALDSLMDMIGLESVKDEFLTIKSKVDTIVGQEISLKNERFGCTLLGNPGTGKTTVARIYSKFLTTAGVIAGQCFKETSGSKLANMGVQGCQQMLDDVLEDGGGVIFIDEAYQLSSGNSPGGRAVLDFLLAEVENLMGKIVFILAGYNKQMESFFAHNPGFPSRFPIEMKFNDYSDDELLRIMKYQLNKKFGGRMKWEDELYLRVSCRRLGRGRGKEGFGNARAVENQLAIIAGRQANRLRKSQRTGKGSDNLLLTKEDLIGPEPANALVDCVAWKKLQGLIGLFSVKESVQALVDSIQTNYQREVCEEPVIEYSLNKVFLGSPGTGKTTVAKLYGQILVDLGLLSNGEVIIKNPADFVGAALGGSEAQTKAILASTAGKVLVIDEAYSLYGGGGNSDPYKTAVIDTIVAEVQSVPGEDRCVLLLGYKDQMEEMFQNVNPGLSRRFPMSSAFTFEDFDQPELRNILDLKLKQQGFGATDQAKNVALEMLARARNRPNFGNAGEVDIILNDAKARHQKRLSSKETSQLATLEALDFDKDFDRAERSDTNVAKLFEGTVGCKLIMAKLEGFQNNVRSMKQLGMDPKEGVPFNFLFRGPPGTGKTSTARKMGKVFYDMGFLATAEVVDCSATDLIGQYVGQTGPKVQQLLDKALGRVLFVDEAYRLAEGPYAKEAVDEIVDCVTKDRYRGRLIIILAGYDNDINRLLSINPGMSSRFPEVIDFHSLGPNDCFTLLLDLLQKQKRRLESKSATNKVNIGALECPTSASRDVMLKRFRELSEQPGWANARDVESLARSMFGEALKHIQGREVSITRDIIEEEFEKMLQERKGRGEQAGTLRDLPTGHLQLPTQAPPTGHRTQVNHETTKAAEDAPNNSAKEDEDRGYTRKVAIRDVGVSDEVWEQLELDKKAQEESNARYQALLKDKNESKGAAREKILKELIEEEERREQEEKQRKKAEMMGRCPVGYAWIKQAQGFRCAGGSHFISDEAISLGA